MENGIDLSLEDSLHRKLRKAFRNIRKTLPDIFHVLVLFLSSIAIFSLLILKLMERRGLSYPNGTEYFTNYWESFWDLYVLVTTANSPDVMMPAYDQSNWFALFFILYMIINIYIFMNIVLAVIYSNYKKHLKNEVKLSVFLKRRLLSQCFLLLRQQAGAIFVITSARWKALMSALRPEMSSVQMELLQYVLDESGTGNIEKRHFLKVADLLQVELTAVTDSPTWLETTFPRMYNSQPSQLICTAVRSRYFTWFFDLLIFINAIFIGLSIEEAEYFFLPAFSLEVALKIYALGPRRFFKSAWNTFDFTIVTAALLVTIIESIIGQSDETRSIVLDILMVLRVLRLIRLLGAIERFNIVLTTIINIGPSIATYGGVIFVFYYVYAILGMELFGGLIRYYGYTDLNQTTNWCGNVKLQESEFFYKRYCSNNFNNVLSSLVLLFELMVVNQWHVLTSGFVLVTNKAARLYFISFHMLCVIFLLNIFTAFVLEVFILEYTLKKGHLENAIENKIKEMGLGIGQQAIGRVKQDQRQLVDEMELDEVPESTTVPTPSSGDLPPVMPWDQEGGLRFRLKNNRTKGVETLLQLMFEGEIDSEEDGHDLDNHLNNDDSDNLPFDTFDLY